MKPTTSAQLAILHVAESAGISALMTIVAGVYQYVLTNGLNVPGLLTFLGTAFVACLAMVYKSVRSDPSLGQAAMDTANEAKAAVESVLPMLHTHPEPVVQTPSLTVTAASAPANLTATTGFAPTPLPAQAFPWTQVTQAVKP